MPSLERRYSKDEFARRGDAVYEQQVAPLATAADQGKAVAIDIESGAFEIDSDEMEASRRLKARHPEAQIWLRRVGTRPLYRYGSSGSKS